MESDLVGKTLSHYRVLSFEGKGGMKSVYRGYDERLRRHVAIKVLLGIATDEASRRLIQDEALVLSRLNHPNIETVFDFDSQDGTDFIVAELIRGKTLSDEIHGLPLQEREILALGAQIADALASAHGKRVVHRDLKPANVIVTPERRVKVLDFGIAKLLGTAGPDEKTKTSQEGSEALTLEAYTNPKGTLPYMAPEVILEGRVDPRTDIYSLGVVLFEMATGRRPFLKRVHAALVQEICHVNPPLPSRLNPRISRRLDEIILKCLEKRPERRYQSAIEVKVDLVRAESQLGPDQNEGEPLWFKQVRAWVRGHPYAVPLMTGIAVFSAAAALILPHLFHPEYVWQPQQLTHSGTAFSPAISPDGKFLAYVETEGTGQRVMVRNIAGGDAREVFRAFQCDGLRWSPDGTQLLCFATDSQAGMPSSYSIPWPGGDPRRFATPGWFGAWSPDGKRFASASPGGRVIHITDVSTEVLTDHPLKTSFNWIDSIDWSPDGKRVAVQISDARTSQIWTLYPDGSHFVRALTDSVSLGSVRWTSNDNLYYLRAHEDSWDLLSISISRHGQVYRRSTVLQGLQATVQFPPFFTISRDASRLIYTRQATRQNLWSVEQSGGSQNPSMTPLTAGTYMDSQPRFSPDGNTIAFTRDDGTASDIFLVPSTGGTPQRLTFMHSWTSSPAWSPDGQQIAFCSNFGGAFHLFHISAQGGAAQVWSQTRSGDGRNSELAWAPGRAILYPDQMNRQYWVFDPETSRERLLLPAITTGAVYSPTFSGDGGTVALLWNDWPQSRSSVWTITSGDSVPRLVYPNGPAFPVGWSPDGHWLYLLDARSEPERIVRIEPKGKRQEDYIVFPKGESVVAATLDPRAKHIVTAVTSSESDICLMIREEKHP